MTSPAASIRGGAVGASTIALAVAAHGVAGGGYPEGSSLVFLIVVGVGVGAMATLPSPGSSRAHLTLVLGGLLLGQIAAHLALTFGAAHQLAHQHAVLPSPAMVAFHVAASAFTAVLVGVAERLYGPITSIIRAVLDPPRTLPNSARPAILAGRVPFSARRRFISSISSRGPPVIRY